MKRLKTVYCLVWYYYDDHEVIAVSKTVEGVRKMMEKLNEREDDRGHYEIDMAKLFDNFTDIDDYYGLSDREE